MEASAFQRPVAAQRPRLPGLRRSDATLAGRVRAGDQRAFEELYDRHAAPLLAFCRHLLGSREGAEDALQHTFLSAHRALERDGAPEHVKAWLYTIARNRCLSVLRARRDEVALDEHGAPVVSTRGLASEVEERADLRALVGDLGRLPDEQRAALVLFELGDHSQDDIAEILGVRREKVKALVFQAREALIGWRAARETPCAHVREQLSTLRGSALRRAPLRRHVELCAGCREFGEQVRRQRACLAVVLPVAPAAGLKSAVMSSALGGGTAAAATTAATSGTAAVGAAAVAKGVAAKAVVAIAVAGGVGGTGLVAVEQASRAPARPAPAMTHPAAPRSSGVTETTPSAPAAAGRATATQSHGRRGTATGRGHSRRSSSATAPRGTRAHGSTGARGRAKPSAAAKAPRSANPPRGHAAGARQRGKTQRTPRLVPGTSSARTPATAGAKRARAPVRAVAAHRGRSVATQP